MKKTEKKKFQVFTKESTDFLYKYINNSSPGLKHQGNKFGWII